MATVLGSCRDGVLQLRSDLAVRAEVRAFPAEVVCVSGFVIQVAFNSRAWLAHN